MIGCKQHTLQDASCFQEYTYHWNISSVIFLALMVVHHSMACVVFG